MKTKSQFIVREFTQSDVPGVLDLIRVSLGETETLKRSDDFWNWKHRDNPFGESHVLLAESESGDIVGLRAFMRWRFRRNGRELRAVRAVDTATHPDFRRMGMFSKLTHQAVDDVRGEGVDLVFNTPNDRSRPGYLKMGWSLVGQTKPIVKVLNYPKFATGLAKYKLTGGSSTAREPGDFESRNPSSSVGDLLGRPGTDRLIAKGLESDDDLIRTDRSVEYFQWRYAQHPTIDYRSAWMEKDGEVVAAAVFRCNTRFGLREIVLSELMFEEPTTANAKSLVDEVKRVARGDYMIAYSQPGSPRQPDFGPAGFRRIPIGALTLTFYPFTPGVPERTTLLDWDVGLGDLEFF